MCLSVFKKKHVDLMVHVFKWLNVTFRPSWFHPVKSLVCPQLLLKCNCLVTLVAIF